MKDPHQLLDYDNWWKKSLGNIKPYAIPPLSPDVIQKLQHQLHNSADRIWRTRKPEEARFIIDLLQEIIDSHTTVEHHNFSWNLSIYKNPPKKQNKVAIVGHSFPLGSKVIVLLTFPILLLLFLR